MLTCFSHKESACNLFILNLQESNKNLDEVIELAKELQKVIQFVNFPVLITHWILEDTSCS